MNNEVLTKRLSTDLEYSPKAISNIVDIQHDILHAENTNVVLKLKSHYICPALFPLIFSLPYAGELYNKMVVVNHRKTNDALSEDVVLYGVDAHFKINSKAVSKNAIVPFCHAPKLDDSVAERIQIIINNIPVNLDITYKMAISSQITEVFNNSYEHGENAIGSFFNSYYDEKEKIFRFTVYDLGEGFKSRIQEYLGKVESNSNIINKWSTSDYIEWAMVRGNTTKPKDYPRGIGYEVLQRFAIENNGEIILCTDDIICHINKFGKSYEGLNNKIRGTFFTMGINLDKSHIYCSKSI